MTRVLTRSGAAQILCLSLSLSLLRLSLVGKFGITLDAAWERGLRFGLTHDLFVAMLPLASALILGAVIPAARLLASTVMAFGIWLATASNYAHFVFFDLQLELWRVLSSTGVIWEIRHTITEILLGPVILGSLALFLASLALSPRHRSHSRAKSLASGVLLLVGALFVRQSTTWFHVPHDKGSVLSDQVLESWWSDWRSGRLSLGAKMGEYATLRAQAPRILAKLAAGSYFSDSEAEPGPLYREFSPGSREVAKLREEFGLDPERPPNIIFVFLESVRGYETHEPSIAPEVFGTVHSVIRRRGISFRQVYTSAEYTTKGQFTALCSQYDSFELASVFRNSPYLRTECIQGLLARNGYETYFMTPFLKGFDGTFNFESAHGMMHFLDNGTFRAANDADKVDMNEWGLADGPFLSQAMDRILKIAERDQPFFAYLLTTGSHAPWRRSKLHDVSPELNRRFEGGNYLGYLTRLKALDDALGAFLERLFSDPKLANTAVFLVSDHSTSVSHEELRLGEASQNLIWSRIFAGVVSPRMKFPRRIEYPIHQVDLAPLAATLAGARGKVAWIGRNPLSGSGTPWISRRGNGLHYVVGGRYCYSSLSRNRMVCLAIGRGPSSKDPLFDDGLSEVPEDPAQSTKARKLMRASDAALLFNELIPAKQWKPIPQRSGLRDR